MDADTIIAAQGLSVTSLADTLADHGRTALLAELKEAGVSALPDRQKVASALAKRAREAALPKRAAPPRSLHRPHCAPSGSESGWFEWVDGAWRSRHTDALAPPSSVASLIVIDDVLTLSECAQLVSRAQQAGFVESRHQGVRDEGFRRGSRAPLTDGGLAAEIFARISRALPPAPAASGGQPSQWAQAAPAGLWESLRVLSYDADDYFLPHRDNACAVGHSSLLPRCQSFFSILLYLADSADGGGATRFYCDELEAPPSATDVPTQLGAPADAPSADVPSGDGSAPAAHRGTLDGRCPVADVVPWAGRAVVFPHRILHESLPIVEGRKLVVRGDVLYAPTSEEPAAAEVRAPSPLAVVS
jgi:hypothetical protein